MSKKTKLWAGRFDKPTVDIVEDFTASIDFDKRLYRYDILGTMAHVRMLAHVGLITNSEAERIIEQLNHIENEIDRGEFVFEQKLEDIHMNIEAVLIGRLGDVGAKVHTARSRNDQVALDVRMYLKDEIDGISRLIRNLQASLVDFAQENIDVIFPGYTHLQHGQPVMLAHHILAYIEMFERDRQRLLDCYKRVDVMPLGACAVAGTSLPVDRDFVRRELGFSHLAENSIDAVSDRDFVIEYLGALAIMGIHFSRMSEELVLWNSHEFGYIELDDAFCTGSSIMPQKKNPDVPELVRGKTSVLIGGLVEVLTLMKGLPLSYNRDMQQDKLPLFRSTDVMKQILAVMADLYMNINVKRDRIMEAMMSDYSVAVDVADYLVLKGMPFREAHQVVGKIVAGLIDKDKGFEEMAADEFKSFSDLFEDDITAMVNHRVSVETKKSYGGTAPELVKHQIEKWKTVLAQES